MKLRLISRVIVLVLVVLVGALMVVRSHADPGPRTPAASPTATPRLGGADLGAVPVLADFTLTDARGDAVTLSRAARASRDADFPLPTLTMGQT